MDSRQETDKSCMQEQSSTANSSQFNDYRVAGNLGNTAGELLSSPNWNRRRFQRRRTVLATRPNDLIRQAVVPASK
jgi:hypothetical protein